MAATRHEHWAHLLSLSADFRDLGVDYRVFGLESIGDVSDKARRQGQVFKFKFKVTWKLCLAKDLLNVALNIYETL